MFSHKDTKECRESRIIIKDSTIAAVRQMVHYMYTGKVSDDYDKVADALPLMAIAHKYQIKPLMDLNEPILINRLVSTFTYWKSARVNLQ
jgi:phospholipid N-methyltransferase